MNIIEGPGPSSVATRVIGTGLLENFGVEAWRDSEGRSAPTECGRLVEDSGLGETLSGSLRDAGLLPASDDALIGVTMFETEGGFAGGISDCVNARSGAEAVALGPVSNGL